jgi:hypothetical protein
MEPMIEAIQRLIAGREQLAQQAYVQYNPLVENIIASRNKDVNHIGLTLDGILDFCFDEQMLQLYRRLCRYLWDIDPESTAFYITAYREMWDEEGKMFGNNKKNVS